MIGKSELISFIGLMMIGGVVGEFIYPIWGAAAGILIGGLAFSEIIYRDKEEEDLLV